MSKAAIFDVDGTLVESVDLHAKAWQDAFHDFGHNFEFEQIRRQIGKGGHQLMPVFLGKGELKEKGEELEEHHGEVLRPRYLHQVRPFSGGPCAVSATPGRWQEDRAYLIRQRG